MHSPPLLPETVQAFKTEGIVVLRGVFRDWVERLRVGVEENMRTPGPYARVYTPEDHTGRFFGDYCNWNRIDAYRAFVLTSPAGRVAGQLMGARQVRLFHEHVLVKEPHTEEATPWHHDQPYYNVDGCMNVSLWIPLDPVAKEVCPEFIAGSHQWGRWFLPRRFNGQDYERPDDGLELLPDFEAERDRYEIRSFELEAGDALAFHFLTVHGAPPNLSRTRRRGFSLRLLGDDATWAERSGDTSPPFPHLKTKLRQGDSLEDVGEFPVIWSARGSQDDSGRVAG